MEKTTAVLRIRFAALVVAFALASCNGGSTGSSGSLPSVSPPSGVGRPARIRHIVLVIQENRSFDDLFSTFPGADGTTYGNWDSPSGEQYILLQKVNLADKCDWGHSYKGFTADYDGNADVYVMSVAGGPPTRLTYHPMADRVIGWHWASPAPVMRLAELVSTRETSDETVATVKDVATACGKNPVVVQDSAGYGAVTITKSATRRTSVSSESIPTTARN